MPIYNWVRMHETGDFTLLIKKKGFFYYNIEQVWRGLLNDFYSKHGIKGDFKEYLKKMRKLTMLICENGIRFDPLKDVKIRLLEQEMTLFTSKTEAVDFFINVTSVSKFIGYRIDPHVMSVSEYYGNIKLMEAQAKAQTKQNGKADKA